MSENEKPVEDIFEEDDKAEESAEAVAEAPADAPVYVFAGRTRHDATIYEKGDVAEGSESTIKGWLANGVIVAK